MKRNKMFFFQLVSICFFMLLFSGSCQLRSKKAMVLSRLQKTAKLATQEVIMSKYLFCDEKQSIFARIFDKAPDLLIYTEANLKFGIDLQKITENDVVIQGDIIRLTLPPVKQLNISMLPEKMRIEDFDKLNPSNLNKGDTELIDKLLRKAQSEMQQTAENLQLAQAAENRTQAFLTQFLEKMGFGAVIIEFKTAKEQEKEDRMMEKAENN